jgi:uncharacterized SAM-dependent methyltransferase
VDLAPASDTFRSAPAADRRGFGPLLALRVLTVLNDNLLRWLVIGLDLAPGPGKSVAELEAAYDDAAGVTAAFNLNLLARINRELAGTVRIGDFAHRAVWNAALGRIEMHLVALRDTDFSADGQHVSLVAGETIHTENSYKWTLPESRLMARASGWTPTTAPVTPRLM